MIFYWNSRLVPLSSLHSGQLMIMAERLGGLSVGLSSLPVSFFTPCIPRNLLIPIWGIAIWLILLPGPAGAGLWPDCEPRGREAGWATCKHGHLLALPQGLCRSDQHWGHMQTSPHPGHWIPSHRHFILAHTNIHMHLAQTSVFSVPEEQEKQKHLFIRDRTDFANLLS